MSVTNSAISNAVSGCEIAKASLTYRGNLGSDDDQNKFHGKICAVCDCLISYGDERALPLTQLRPGTIVYGKLKKVNVNWTLYNVRNTIRKQIEKYYTVRCYDTVIRRYRFLRDVMLSPRAYRTVTACNQKKESLGCCRTCFSSLNNMKRFDTTNDLPKFAIANGCFYGKAPKVLEELNEVELAIVTPSRINKHVFSYTAGSHQQIKGWHSMYYSDMATVNGAVNWAVEVTGNESNGENDSDGDESFTSTTVETVQSDNDYHNEDVSNDNDAAHTSNPKFAEIYIVLSGPFTANQHALTKERVKVNWSKIRKAKEWLCKNNIKFNELNLPPNQKIEPLVIDKTSMAETQNSNIEEQFQINAVFPDVNEPNEMNGGFQKRSEFFDSTLEQYTTRGSAVDATMIVRPTPTLLRDYEGDNFIKAFPLHFPYGIGGYDENGERRSGVLFYKHLSTLSNTHFHRPQFCCILYNMWARSKMVSKAYFSTPEYETDQYCNLTETSVKEAVERKQNGVTGSSVGDLFLRRLQSTSSALPHSAAAAKNARQKMFAYIAKFGLPAVLYTITPEDNVNFRIRVLCSGADGEGIPPDVDRPVEELVNFVLDCQSLRVDYPGMCAWDFQQVIAIVIEHVIGWDREKKCNKDNYGMFGDIDAWCSATEEQNRKTLHSHFLLWVKNWNDLLRRLHDLEEQNMAIQEMIVYTTRTICTQLFGATDAVVCCNPDCSTGGGMEECSVQDIRNLRHKCGETDFGGRNLFQCNECNTGATSEDVVEHQLKSILPYSDETRIWDDSYNLTKRQVQMEMMLLGGSLPLEKNRKENKEESELRNERIVNTSLRNLHHSKHCKTCFKGQNRKECRMKLPMMPCDETSLEYDDHYTEWYDYRGRPKHRRMFTVKCKRTHGDCFVNPHHQHSSDLFDCNTNVATGLDGGSVFYCTCYVSKNTFEEDGEHFNKAARDMAIKLNETVQEGTDGDGNEEQNNNRKRGLRAVIGSVLMATNAHVVAAPMASYLVRHGSRFSFSHDFAFTYLRDFHKDGVPDFNIDSDENGRIFLKSRVTNYLQRPTELENVCLYDFLCQYTTCRANKGSLEWAGEHVSNGNLKVSRLKKDRVPIINHLDFSSTKVFTGRDIAVEDIDDEPDVIQVAMEKHARNIVTAFIPFRTLNNLTDDGRFLPILQHYMLNKLFSDNALSVIQNIQICHNSIVAGRPKDPLERATDEPHFVTGGNQNEQDEEEVNAAAEEAWEEVLSNMSNLLGDGEYLLRDGANRLRVDSKIINLAGSNKCGMECVKKPAVDVTKNVVGLTPTQSSSQSTGNWTSTVPSKLSLVELSVTVTNRNVDGSTTNDLVVTGTLQNIRLHADVLFEGDEDQKRAFESILSAFFVKVHERAKDDIVSRTDSVSLNRITSHFKKVNRSGAYVVLLHGPGGTGKSHVIKQVINYAKRAFLNMGLLFDKRTIVVTAVTGSAAVSIRGETTCSAACLKHSRIPTDVQDEYRHTYMFICDEISFAGKSTPEELHVKLKEIMESHEIYGGLPMVYAGDFTQLKPVRQKPLYLLKEPVPEFHDWVHTMLELKTNHRFKNDRRWGEMLLRCREEGLSMEDVCTLNRRVVDSVHGPSSAALPDDLVYVTKTNIDKAAINSAIFFEHVKNTHFKNEQVPPPFHTICIRAGDLEWRKARTKREFYAFKQDAKDIFHSCCSDAHVKENGKCYDPMLKLYYGRPLCISENLDVSNCVANGTMCSFEGIVLKEGIAMSELDIIVMDGYYVRCADICQVQSIKVKILDGQDEGIELYMDLEPITRTCMVHFPVPFDGGLTSKTTRVWKRMKMKQFPINTANCRTCHKLQGRTIKNLFISNWAYVGNWLYVCLSRCTTIGGLYFRNQLDWSKCKGMSEECQEFLSKWRRDKKVPPKHEPTIWE